MALTRRVFLFALGIGLLPAGVARAHHRPSHKTVEVVAPVLEIVEVI